MQILTLVQGTNAEVGAFGGGGGKPTLLLPSQPSTYSYARICGGVKPVIASCYGVGTSADHQFADRQFADRCLLTASLLTAYLLAVYATVCWRFCMQCLSLHGFHPTAHRGRLFGVAVGSGHLLRRLVLADAVLLLLLAAAHVSLDVLEYDIVHDAHDQEEPEQIQGLQHGEQGKRNVLGDPALVLMHLEVELERAHRFELGGDAVENA